MKRLFIVLITLVMIFTLSACADTTVKGSVVRESTYGNAELDIMPQKLLEIAEVGDTVLVTIGNFSEEMLFVDKLIEEDGKLQLFFSEQNPGYLVSGVIFTGLPPPGCHPGSTLTDS